MGTESAMTTARRANDLLINVDMGDNVQPDWIVRVKEDYFRAVAFAEQHPDRFFMGLGGHDTLRPMPTLKAPTEAFFFSRFES
jgi:hypothetical protein